MHVAMPHEGRLSCHRTAQGDPMTYNRMEAKPIAGEHCRFGSDARAPLVKTPCCQQWICCDKGSGQNDVKMHAKTESIGV